MERRGREPLEEESFMNHFFDFPYEQTIMYGDDTKGYLLGGISENIYFPSHFAPKTLRQGYSLLKDLGKGDFDSVLFITEDLATTLAKMGEWKIEDFEIPMEFRGEVVKKKVAHNNIHRFAERLNEYVEKKIGRSKN